jgi:hypothetical protein
MTNSPNCAEDYSKRTMNLSIALDKNAWSATRVWTVFSTDPNWSSSSVTPLPGNDPLPNGGDPHPQNAALVATLGTTKATDNPTVWEVTMVYRITPNVSLEPNPLLQPPKWRFLIGEESVPLFFDKDGNPIVNSAGDFFDPQPQDIRGTLSIRITRCESTYDVNKALQYMNSTNSDPWVLPNGQTVQPGQARMHSIEQIGDVDKNSRYVPMCYVAYLTPNDFNLIAVDQGFQSWDTPPGGSGPALEKIYNASTGLGATSVSPNPTLISAPALLNGYGQAMVPANYQLGIMGGSPTANPNTLPYITRVTTTPGVVGLKFKQLKLQAFNALNLV